MFESEFMQRVSRGAAVASLSAVCLAGCSSPGESSVPTEALYGESAVQSPLYEELTAENDSVTPQDSEPIVTDQEADATEDDSTIGTPMWGELETLENGTTRVSMFENIRGFVLDEDASFAVIEADCHPGREPKVSILNNLNSGAQYSISCERDGVLDNRPNVLKKSVDLSKSYKDMMPTEPNETVAVVAYHGELSFRHVPDGEQTIIELGNPTNLEISQISISK